MSVVFHGKPVIGIAGGIGSGKSYVARLFGELGCAVIDSDAQVGEIYRDPAVLATLRAWWGDEVVAAGAVDRRAVAKRVFHNPADRERLEGLIHPLVNDRRVQTMQAALVQHPGLPAFVWDSPLLFETGLYQQCDSLVFVDSPLEMRQNRVTVRGWDQAELQRRENLQWPLDKKRLLCNDVVVNSTGSAANSGEASEIDTRGQIGQVLSRILARSSNRPDPA